MRIAQTVLGPVAPEQLGFTLPHEHLFWDLHFYLPSDLDVDDPADVRNTPICPEVLGDLKYHLQEYSDNMVHTDVASSLKELAWYKQASGQTLTALAIAQKETGTSILIHQPGLDHTDDH